MELYQPYFTVVAFFLKSQQYRASSPTAKQMSLTHSFHDGIIFCSINYRILIYLSRLMNSLCSTFCYYMLLDFKTLKLSFFI